MYRCMPKNEDQSWFVALLVTPFVLFLLYWLTKSFFTEEVRGYKGAILVSYIIMAIFIYAIIVIIIIIGIHNVLWASSKCSPMETGLLIRYITGKQKIVSWEKIQDVCACNMYANFGYKHPVIRFTTDVALDKSKRAQKRKGAILNGWPRWLDLDFIMFHSNKITVFEYSPEAEEEVRKFYPNLRNCLNIR